MCRVEERVYILADGRRQTFEETVHCDKAHRGKVCSKVKRRTTEYFKPPPPAISRDDASSPASNNPPTPTGTGSYFVEERRPSVSRRPSTREGHRVAAIKPEIVIEIGGGKGKGKGYPHVSLSTRAYKRSSLGTASIASNEVAVESPGSDASYTIRTGFPEAPVPPTDSFGNPPGYTTRHAVPQSHHRHTSSASSFTTSSQPPSLYATSEPESPSGRRAPRYPPTIVHNPPPGAVPSSPAASRTAPLTPSSPYRTTIAVPQSSSRDSLGADGLTPLDYSDFHDHSASSHASSSRAAAPEITDRGADRERRRKQREDEKRRQEEADRRFAEELAKEQVKEEEVKQVRFELGRAEERQRQRGEKSFAESERRRAELREEERRHKAKEQEEKAAKESRREKTKPPTREFPKPAGRSRRPSMTQAEIEEQKRLLAATEAQMAREREATEQREREERAAQLRQEQQTNAYWDPRGGNSYAIANHGPGIARRGSVSHGRRPSISNPPPATGLERRNSTRRGSVVIQQAPPSINTSFAQTPYSTRPPSSHAAAPLFSPSSYNPPTRPPSARHPSYHQENPFAQPPTAIQHDNPFAQAPSAVHSPPTTAGNPWDTRDIREALPRTNSYREQHYSRRGDDFASRAAADDRTRAHTRAAQQATRTMGKVVGYEDDYESSSENGEDRAAGYGARIGLGKSGKRRN